jgi:hypothetical protein
MKIPRLSYIAVGVVALTLLGVLGIGVILGVEVAYEQLFDL